MAFDGVITKTIVYELNNSLCNGKINKIFEPNKNEILLGIYANGKNFALNICIDPNNYRIHLTTNIKPNPQNAPNFCMLLRKHILGYKIKGIESYDLERIIIIHLEGYNELNDLTNKKLVIELMGKHSNIILLNNSDFIIDSLRHLDISSNSTRDILPAHSYILPQNNKYSFLNLSSFEEFKKILNKNTDEAINKSIANNFIGFSISFVNTALNELKIDKSLPINQLSDSVLNNIFNYISSILNGISTGASSIIVFNNEKGKPDYSIVFKDKSDPLEVNFFIDDFYFSKETNDYFMSYRNNILKLIFNILTKYTNRIKSIDNKLAECSNKDTYKLYGELITANLYKFKDNNNKNLESITVENYYDNNNLISIPLDKRFSIHVNASRYFKKYNKLKNALEIVSIQKEDAKKEIEYLESIIYELESSKNISDINEIYTELSSNPIFAEYFKIKKDSTKNKDEKKNSSPREYTIDGYTVLVGKNNVQNDYLTTKLADKNDIWFHTKDIHGSHVILKNNSSTELPSNDILIKCAQIAAFYSKAKLSSNVPVDYCFVKYVKKVSGSKPGMVIYTNNKTLTVTPSDPNL